MSMSSEELTALAVGVSLGLGPFLFSWILSLIVEGKKR